MCLLVPAPWQNQGWVFSVEGAALQASRENEELMQQQESRSSSSTQPQEALVESLFAQMTLTEKIGQMAQVEKNSLTPQDVTDYLLGSVLSGGGGNPPSNDPASWARMVRQFQEAALRTRLAIPLLYGVDAVHGHNNLRGSTIFPHNIGLGAAGDPNLVTRIAQVTARELLATNVHWNFAPAVSVPQDIRWGRTYEGFSEDPALVARLGAAYVRGLHGSHSTTQRPVLASVKHFVGDGGTSWGSTQRYAWIPEIWQSNDATRWQLDQGDTRVDEPTLRSLHLSPYVAAIAAGARNIMVSYNSWNGVKLHRHRYLLTDLLKGELGFDGFLVSDWMALVQLDPDPLQALALALNAGLDMVMIPFDYRAFITQVTHAVEMGLVPMARIDDAVRRILRVKWELGLFTQPFGDETLLSTVGSAAHRQVAREAVRKSLVLLKNEGGVLPLAPTVPHILVAGGAADDLGVQCGGWTIEWQGGRGSITTGTTLLAALRQEAPNGSLIDYQPEGQFAEGVHAPVALVVLGEAPYAEGEGDRADLSLSTDDIALVERVRGHCERLVVLLYSGRPLLIDPILPLCDALVAAWLPGTEGAGVVDLLFGAAPFTGTLPYTWPQGAEPNPLFPRGYGLT